MKKIIFLIVAILATVSAKAVTMEEILGLWKSDTMTEKEESMNMEFSQSFVVKFIDSGECAISFTLTMKQTLGDGISVEASAFLGGKGTYTVKDEKIAIEVKDDYVISIPDESIVIEGIDDPNMAAQMGTGIFQVLQMTCEYGAPQMKKIDLKKCTLVDETTMTCTQDGDKYTLTKLR